MYTLRTFLKRFAPDSFINAYHRLLREKENIVYRGNNVICPCCKSTYISFATYIPTKRKNARCIECGSLERHRLQYLYLTEKTNLFDENINLQLLHFAPEKPLYDAIKKRNNISYTPCDLSPKSYEFRNMPEIQKVDITNIPFNDNSLDVILCNHVLEHIEDDLQAMTELFRVLKVGGWGIFQVPIRYRNEKTYEDFSIKSPQGRKKAFGQHDHVRIYGRDYGSRLQNAGFTVTKDEYARNLLEAECMRFGINPREIIYVCRK